MLKHIRIYLSYFGYGEQDFIPCENCKNKRSADVHHIDNKGMGGSKTKDYIENLVALCRDCHLKCHKDKEFNEKVKQVHLEKLKAWRLP